MTSRFAVAGAMALVSLVVGHAVQAEDAAPAEIPGWALRQGTWQPLEPYVAGQPRATGLQSPFPQMRSLDSNPMTPDKVALGKLLFFDPIASGENTISCAHCHHPDHGLADGRKLSMGFGGQGIGPERTGGHELGRHAPTLWNAAYQKWQFWDGRAEDLEQQAAGPITNEHEMGEKPETLVKELRENPEYVALFQKAFGGTAEEAVTFENVCRAIAGVRADAAVRQLAVRPLRSWRRLGTERAGTQRHEVVSLAQDSLLRVPQFPDLRRRVVSRDRRARWRTARPRSGERAGRRAGWRVQDAGAAQHRADRALHAQRRVQHAGRGDQVLCQGRRSRRTQSARGHGRQDRQVRHHRRRDRRPGRVLEIVDRHLAATRAAGPRAQRSADRGGEDPTATGPAAATLAARAQCSGRSFSGGPAGKRRSTGDRTCPGRAADRLFERQHAPHSRPRGGSSPGRSALVDNAVRKTGGRQRHVHRAAGSIDPGRRRPLPAGRSRGDRTGRLSTDGRGRPQRSDASRGCNGKGPAGARRRRHAERRRAGLRQRTSRSRV